MIAVVDQLVNKMEEHVSSGLLFQKVKIKM